MSATSSSCPVCGKPVDALRAPAVKVRAGKVIGYCSQACAQSAETKPVVVAAVTAARKDQTPVPKKKARTPPAGVATPSSLLDSGPVIEIIHEPASGVVTSAADARASGKSAVTAARSETSGAIQIADTGHLDDFVAPDDDGDEPRRGKGKFAIAAIVILAGAGFAAYQLGYLDGLLHRDSHAATRPLHDDGSAAAAIAGPIGAPGTGSAAAVAPALTAVDAVDRARAALHAALASDSPHVRRLAAAALARTGASEAVVPLIADLPNEPSDAAKLDIYYALARGADKRGTDGLVARLQIQGRDGKLDAARMLAMLGDKRAAAPLAPYLDVPQQRLGAAESLAYLADPRAIKALAAIRADGSASSDEKARAAIALGIAGEKDVAPALRDLLGDAQFNAFAAAALAELHDAAAVPVLERQLDVPPLRVGAARALRRLDPSRDVAPLLPRLVAAVDRATGEAQVEAAEAVLVLAGPPAWSEHP